MLDCGCKRTKIGDPGWKPWIEIKQDNGALLHVRQCGHLFTLIGPKARFVSDVMTEKEYFSLYKKLGREPTHWPETGPERPKSNVKNSGVT